MLLAKHNREEEKLGVSYLSFSGNYYDSDNGNNININKKIKKVELGPLLNKLRLKTFAFFIVFLMFFAGSTFYLNILTNPTLISSINWPRKVVMSSSHSLCSQRHSWLLSSVSPIAHSMMSNTLNTSNKIFPNLCK
jgi:hypothetical protein